MKKNAKRITVIALLLASILAFAAIVAFFEAPTPQPTPQPVPQPVPQPTPQPTATIKYIVTNVGDTYYANVPNGTMLTSGTNAATVINAALDALTPGRVVKERVLLQGTFNLTSMINVPSYSILDATGSKLTFTSTASGYMAYANDKSNFEVVGGDWNGNNANRDGTSDYDPLSFMNCNDLIIRDLIVHHSPQNCIDLYSCRGIIIRNVEAYNCDGSLCGLVDCNTGTIESCRFHNGQAGLYVYTETSGLDMSNFIIRNNLIQGTNQTGIEAPSLRQTTDTGSNYLIENNTIVDCGMDTQHGGITIGWSKGGAASPINHALQCTVRNNTIYETGSASGGCGGGIMCLADDSIVSNNTIHDLWGVGVAVRGDRNTVSDNQITACGVKATWYPGIQILDGNNNELSRNSISSCLSGIVLTVGVSTGCNHNEIAYNHFASINNMTAQIDDADSTGNIIENNTYSGTWQVFNMGTGTIIRNNTIAP